MMNSGFASFIGIKRNMKSTSFTDSLGKTYIFEFHQYGNFNDVIIHNDDYTRAISIKQIIENSESWQDLNKHLKMSPDSIKYIEKFCKNIAFW